MYGMGCERLTGATLVLGDGTIRQLGNSAALGAGKPTKKKTTSTEQDKQLLWAIRGGGGLSYGIVTEFVFEPFVLPDVAVSFSISSDCLPEFRELKATDVILAWENLTQAGKNPQLIGTNLKVVAKAVDSECEVSDDAILDWQLNGHFGGTCDELQNMLEEFLTGVAYLIVHNHDSHESVFKKLQRMKDIERKLIGHFDKICDESTTHKAPVKGKDNQPYALSFEHWDQHRKTTLSLETDGPAPHKITSKMPTPDWDCNSRKALVRSLQSPLLKGDSETSISAYITLGAISGHFYQDGGSHQAMAFPYADRPFTIQYQAWWNTTDCASGVCVMDKKTIEQLTETRFQENRAQDWIEACRNFNIPNTCGSFISFKDSSVPTRDYFGDHYQTLIDVKMNCSKDKKCYLRSRKTII